MAKEHNKNQKNITSYFNFIAGCLTALSSMLLIATAFITLYNGDTNLSLDLGTLGGVMFIVSYINFKYAHE